MHKPEEALAVICSVLEYCQDRGELTEDDDVRVKSPHIRYTSVTEIPDFTLVVGDREVRVTAVDVGPHVHQWVADDYCESCGANHPNNQ